MFNQVPSLAVHFCGPPQAKYYYRCTVPMYIKVYPKKVLNRYRHSRPQGFTPFLFTNCGANTLYIWCIAALNH
jgi:hypothetical protein